LTFVVAWIWQLWEVMVFMLIFVTVFFGKYLATFNTLYVDYNVCITHTSRLLFEQLGVFVCADYTIFEDKNEVLEPLAMELRVEEIVEVERSAAGTVEREVGTAVDVMRMRDMGTNVWKIMRIWKA